MQSSKARQRNEGIKIRKELLLFSDNISAYTEKSKESINKNEFSTLAGYKVSILKNMYFCLATTKGKLSSER